jgi:hypothetical protein
LEETARRGGPGCHTIKNSLINIRIRKEYEEVMNKI